MAEEASRPCSVSELTEIIKEILESTLTVVTVEGEISNLRQQSSGHLYFTLKDAGAQLSVVMFKWEAARLGFVPQDGMQVVARGEISVYPPRGNYQLKATSLRPKGKGTLQEQFEALKKKLSAEGLFDDDRKKTLPVFPEKVTIITSPTGAAVRDFCQILRRRCPRIEITVFGVKVQGQGAAEEIADAVAEVNRIGEADILILARGGGSIEDLWAFNEEKVVHAVAASTIPTISGVGHEIDFTLCDFASDLRAPTPSAAAEILSKSDDEWREDLLRKRTDLTQFVADFIAEMRQRLVTFSDHYVFREPMRIIEDYAQQVDQLQGSLSRSALRTVERAREKYHYLEERFSRTSPRDMISEKRERLTAFQTQLRLLSPQATLSRGYALVLDPKGKLVKTAASAGKEKKLKLRFQDGEQEVSPIREK